MRRYQSFEHVGIVEAALITGESPDSLRELKEEGLGPESIAHPDDGRPLYRIGDLHNWLEGLRQMSA